uniref:Uncharacterized protein n=1 Tax=Cacopsylla melanoneura TaxID=428564 RepID=A0A8D9FB32_9HEMI
MVTPPMSFLLSLRSRRVLSNASRPPLWDMVHSSQIIMDASVRTLATAVPFLMLHVGLSEKPRFKGSLKAAWAVRPPSKRVAAIPDEATATAICLLDLIFARIRFIRKVFPVPPGASKKNSFPSR